MNTLAAVLIAVAAAAPVDLSQHPQLFLDDYLVARMDNLRREVQQPVKHPANPLLTRDFPWETRFMQVYGTVLYEPDKGGFRMWYLGSEDPDAVPEYYQCYAESPDGVAWTKPLVGAPQLHGHVQHNIVIPGGHGMCILREDDGTYRGLGGASLASSTDGIQWTLSQFPSAGKNDTSSCVVKWRGEYLAFVRNQAPDPDWPGVMRAVALCTSRDFATWTPKQTVLITDEQDGYPWTQVYGMAVTPYGDVLIGLPWFLHLDKTEGNNALGDLDVQLAVSRDGRAWNRVADRAPFLTSTPGTWDAGRVFPGTTLVIKDDEVRLYYSGDTTRHGEKVAAPGIGLATLPADRFVAIRQEKLDTPGVLETVLLQPSGNVLTVNAEIGADGLAVEVLDDAGSVLPGYSRDACVLTPADPLRRRAQWRSGDALNNLPPGPCRLRFILSGGALFAFCITN